METQNLLFKWITIISKSTNIQKVSLKVENVSLPSQGCLKRKPNLILAQYGIMAKHFLAAYGHMAARRKNGK